MLKFKSSASSFSLKTLIKLIFNPDTYLTIISNFKISYYVGDRIGQIIILPYPQIEFEEAEELSETERGNGGYGKYRDWETDRKSTRLNSSHRSLSRMPSSA